jgi:hypothetical protein
VPLLGGFHSSDAIQSSQLSFPVIEENHNDGSKRGRWKLEWKDDEE